MTSPDAEPPQPPSPEPEVAAPAEGQLARPWVGLAIIAVVVVAAVIGAVGFAILRGGHSPAVPTALSQPGTGSPTASSAPASTSVGASDSAKSAGPAAPGRSAPVTAAGLAASGGALRLPSNERKLALGWASGPGGKKLTQVSQASGFVLQAGAVGQYGQMRYGCIHLASVVAAAKSGPPIPNMKMQKLYATALSTFAKGAADCRRAISAAPDGDESVQTHENGQLLNR